MFTGYTKAVTPPTLLRYRDLAGDMAAPLIQSLIPVSFTYAAGPLLMEACFGLL